MERKTSTLEGYALNMETHNDFNPEKLYHGRLKVNCTAREARFCEAKKRGPRNKAIYDGHYVAVSYSRKRDAYWYRFKNGNLEDLKPNLVAVELGLAMLAVEKHQSSNKNNTTGK